MTGATPNGGPRETPLQKFLADDWTIWLDLYPEAGTIFGFPGYDDRWTDDSPDGIRKRRTQLEASLARLRSFPREELDAGDRVDYDLYLDLFETAVLGLEFGDEPNPFHYGMPHNLWMPMNQMEGIHLSSADLLGMQPRQTSAELGRAVARLRRLPTAIDQNLALMKAGLEKGYSPARAAIHGVPDQVKGLIRDDPTSSALLESFHERPTMVSESDWARLVDEARAAYLEDVKPALERLHAYLVAEYLPACRSGVGLSSLPRGAEAYNHYIRWQTTTSLTAKQIHDIGLAELDRIHREMEEVKVRAGFTGTLPEFFAFLRTDPKFFYGEPEQLIERYRALAKEADPGLARLFGRLPRLPYGVLPMPAFKAASSPAAYYFVGAAASGRAGYFYANTHEMGSRPRWEMEDLVLHEAVPGHHLQIALAAEMEQLASFRKFSGYTAFVEGWGLYAETLGEELGFYKDPYSKMGQLVADAWRSVRLVVDTGMHALGWTREQAIKFFAENAGRSEADITVEVDRYIVWPGQALAYKIGQLKFRELRDRAERRLGEKFDVRGFHDTVLGEGGIPLGMVDERVTAWIDHQARASGT